LNRNGLDSMVATGSRGHHVAIFVRFRERKRDRWHRMRLAYLTAPRHVAKQACKVATSWAEMATSDGDLATSMATSR
jgi:hypothetical protein